LPILWVVLAASAGGLTDRARPVEQTAISIQGHHARPGRTQLAERLWRPRRPGIWFISDATELAIIATGMIFTAAVRGSQALQLPMPQFEDFLEDDEDLEEED
jgi:hypothetical protein